MDNPMVRSRQPQGRGLLGLLLALSLMHMSPPAQAGERGSETAVRDVEQAVQGPLGIAPLSLAVVLARISHRWYGRRPYLVA